MEKKRLRKILYYPTINIPSENWLRHSLLYYDKVSSIVPVDLENNYLSQDLQFLKDAGQFESIPAHRIFMGEYDVLNNFFDEVTKMISTIKPENRSNEFYKIHMDKISSKVLRDLDKKRLMKPVDYTSYWYEFEKTAAMYYMSILAKYIAANDSENTIIGTDNIEYEKMNFRSVSKENGIPVLHINQNDFLPVPRENVSFQKIIDFKRRRKDNLDHFIEELSKFQLELSKVDNIKAYKDLVDNFNLRLQNRVNDLTRLFGESKIDCVQKTLKSMITIKSPTLLLSGLNIAGKIDSPHLLVSMGVIEFAFNYIDGVVKQKSKLADSNFSYLHHGYNEGIINKPI